MRQKVPSGSRRGPVGAGSRIVLIRRPPPSSRRHPHHHKPPAFVREMADKGERQEGALEKNVLSDSSAFTTDEQERGRGGTSVCRRPEAHLRNTAASHRGGGALAKKRSAPVGCVGWRFHRDSLGSHACLHSYGPNELQRGDTPGLRNSK
ncbi:unnamed protein product [Pleuronectes platessa]|uniref:Uncharacterized protein n=1 Tax=Pleuronectes platessa TaxID=8262 RepID=A0A9N7VRE1_PLEPL|nr:unnamed protein product [Pleuronectes platessa]